MPLAGTPRKHLPTVTRTATNLMAPKHKVSLRRKLLFAAITTLGFFLLLELGLIACGVRPQAQYEDPYVGFSSYLPLFVEEQHGDGAEWLVTAPNKRRWFNEQKFPRKKSKGGFRVFCLGGSTTYGRPYDDRTSFCGWLREFLPLADSSRSWEVINAGGISYASYRAARVMEELLDYHPDLFVIYSGHNEFLEARSYEHLQEMPSAVRGLGGLLSHTRTYTAIAAMLGKLKGNPENHSESENRELLPSEVKTLLDNAIGPDVYSRDDELHKQILSHYELNLRRMIEMARDRGARVILVTPASNLLDCSPFKSEHRSQLSDSDLEQWNEHYERGKAALAAEKFDEALQAFDRAEEIDDRYADLHYLRGQALAALERYADAKTAFVRARDEDICPLRAPTEIRSIVLRVANELNVPVVDFVGQLDELASHAIPGKDQFLDHVHPTIDMHRELALQLLDQLAEQRLLTLSPSWGEGAIRSVTERIESGIDQQAQAKALRNLSKVLGWAGKTEEADRLAMEAVRLADDDFEAHYQAANALMREGKIDEALDRYTRALRLEPNSALTHYGLALAWSEKGDPQKAATHYERAIALNPDYADAHYNLGNLYFGGGNLDRAAYHFRQAIRCMPRDSDAYNNLGLVLANQGKIPEAKIQFELAVQANPKSADAHANLGRALQELGDPDAAIRHYTKAIQLQPGHPEASALLRALRKKGQ